MKPLFALLIFFSSASAFSARGYFDNFDKDRCPGMWTSHYRIICFGVKGSREILAAKIKKSNQVTLEQAARIIKNLQIADAYELGVLPDDSTEHIYAYTYLLKDSSGKVIGYSAIDGYVNHEMEIRLQINQSYTVKGEMVSAIVKELN